MALLRDRASGIMDYIGRIGADLITPPQASPVMPTSTSPMQMAMNRPQVQFSQPSASTMVTTMPDGTMAMASPTPQIRQEMTGAGVTGPRMNPPQVVPARPEIRDMGGAGVLMTGPQLEQARLASQVVEEVQKNPEIQRDPTFMDGVRSYFGNRENMVRLALAFNSMRTRPDAGLAAVLGDELKDLRASRTTSRTAQAVAMRLRQMGPEYAQYAEMVENNPALANEVMKQIVQREFKPEAAIKTSGPQVDQTTGQVYVVKTDPNTGEIVRQDIEGAMGMTEAAKLALQAGSEDKARDIQAAQEAGRAAFNRAGSLDGQISRLQNARDALDRGAISGWVEQYLPAFDAATADLRATANSLGIDIINSATFGALSEKELALALSTGLPIGLPENELKTYIRDKIEAQSKLRDELLKDARELVGGQTRYSDFISRRADQALSKRTSKAPEGVDQEIWENMTPSERALFQ